MADVTRLDNLFIKPIASLAVATPQWTWARTAAGDVYVQTGVGLNTTYVLWQSAAGVAPVDAPPANTLEVAISGKPYTNIATALAAAVAGATVLVYPGTYVIDAAGLTVPAGVTLQGLSRDTVVLTAVAAAPAIAINLGAGSAVETLELLMANAALDGIVMTGAGSVVNDVRIGAAAATNTPIGIRALGAGCEIRDVTYFTAMGTGLNVGAAGTVKAFNLATEGQIVGVAANFITTLGNLEVVGAVLNVTLTLGVQVGSGGILRCAGVSLPQSGGFIAAAGAVILDLRAVLGSSLTVAAGVTVLAPNGVGGATPALTAGAAAGQFPIRYGTAVVLNATASIVVPVAAIGGAAYDGKPAFAMLRAADGVLYVLRCTWDGVGNLTITLSGAATANRDVSWFVIG